MKRRGVFPKLHVGPAQPPQDSVAARAVQQAMRDGRSDVALEIERIQQASCTGQSAIVYRRLQSRYSAADLAMTEAQIAAEMRARGYVQVGSGPERLEYSTTSLRAWLETLTCRWTCADLVELLAHLRRITRGSTFDSIQIAAVETAIAVRGC